MSINLMATTDKNRRPSLKPDMPGSKRSGTRFLPGMNP